MEDLRIDKAIKATAVIQAAYAVERNAEKRGAEKVSNQVFGIWLQQVEAHVQFIETHGLPVQGT